MSTLRSSPSARLDDYIGRVGRRLRVEVASRGVGATALAALLLTALCVYVANQFGFSDRSVLSARTLLFGSLLAILFFMLLRPLLRFGKRNVAGQLERSVPALDGRVQTFMDRASETAAGGKPSPMIDLLAEDTLQVTEIVPAEEVVSSQRIATAAIAGLVAVGVLIWLGMAGPGYWGYGTARLWGGWMKPTASPLYQIVVEPGNTTVRQGADLHVKVRTIGFESPTAQLFAKFGSGVTWEEAPMNRQIEGDGFEFLFAGVREPLRYYIAAGGIHSEEFVVDVVEMPTITKIRLRYQYPDWAGMEDIVQDPGGDISAVKGTTVEVEVETDKPLSTGVLHLNGATSVPMKASALLSSGKIDVQQDGEYYIAALYKGEIVRLSDDYFITLVPDNKPVVSIARPGRDYRASNIEEVVAQVEAADDFGISSLDLYYSVNGGQPQHAPLRARRGAKETKLNHTFYLEELGGDDAAAGEAKPGAPQLVPGDIVSYYAVAKDHASSTQTDIYFIEVQPYDREFYQSQQGGGMPGEGERQNEISKRQKELIAATWNLIKKLADASAADRTEIRDNAIVLSDIQLTLRDQANTLAERARARQLAGANARFKGFVENLEAAVSHMEPAADRLREYKLQESISPQQKALQYLLRAEAIFREIQLSFGQGGGGGGGGEALDLAEMFELEMDLHKNQYETGGGASGQQLQQEIDEAMEKLRELAKRQERLAEQRQRQESPTFAERWQQEMLRREALELKRQLEQLERRQQGQQQSAQQSGQQQSGQQQGGQQQGGQQQGGQQQSGQRGSQGQSASQSNLKGIIDRLEQATQEMRPGNAGNPEDGNRLTQGQDEARARRAQERLQEALRDIDRARGQQNASALGEIARRTGRLAAEQEQVGERLKEDSRQAIANLKQNQQDGRRIRLQSGLSARESIELAERKAQMAQELEAIEREMQQTIRRLGSSQRAAAEKLREALGNSQQAEIGTELRKASEWIRRGYSPYVGQGEDGVSRALQQLKEQAEQAEKLAQAGGSSREEGLERSLSQLEELRRQLEQAAGMDPGRQGQQQGSQQAGNQPGQDQQGQGQQGQGQQQGGQQQGNQQGQGQQGQGQQAGNQQGQGQQGQGQQGQGQQGQGQQSGQQGGGNQPGQQGGGQQGGGQQGQGGGGQNGDPSGGQRAFGGGGPGGQRGGPLQGFGSASNYGNDGQRGMPGADDLETRRAMEEALQQSGRAVPNITRQLRAQGIYQEDLEELRRFVQGLPNSRFANNPKLLNEEYRKMLAMLEQLELQVRRQVEEDSGGQVRSIVAEPVPEQYREAVAEYFRKLSQRNNAK